SPAPACTNQLESAASLRWGLFYGRSKCIGQTGTLGCLISPKPAIAPRWLSAWRVKSLARLLGYQQATPALTESRPSKFLSCRISTQCVCLGQRTARLRYSLAE